MKRTIKVVALSLAILAFFIFVGSPFHQAASAVAGVDDALIAIIIAALAACGITIAVTGAYGSLQEYVAGLLKEWAESQNSTVSAMFRGAQSGVNKLGQLILNNRFVIAIDTFIVWLKAKFNLQDNAVVNVVSGNATVGGMTVYELPFTVARNDNDYFREYTLFTGQNVYVVIAGGENAGYSLRFFSDYHSYIQKIVIRGNGTVSTGDPVELTWNENWQKYRYADSITYSQSTSDTGYSSFFSALDYYSVSEINSTMHNLLVPGSAPIDIYTGTIVAPSDDPDYVAGDGAILDVGADWGVDYGDVVDVTIPGEFSGVDLGEAAIEYVEEEVAAEQVEQAAEQAISRDPSDYEVTGLSSVFPFCIPFDIYNFLSALAADPEAPSITARFYIPGICDEEIEIDLSAFDSVARILRTMELLAFCVGLAFETRKLIRG